MRRERQSIDHLFQDLEMPLETTLFLSSKEMSSSKELKKPKKAKEKRLHILWKRNWKVTLKKKRNRLLMKLRKSKRRLKERNLSTSSSLNFSLRRERLLAQKKKSLTGKKPLWKLMKFSKWAKAMPLKKWVMINSMSSKTNFWKIEIFLQNKKSVRHPTKS